MKKRLKIKKIERAIDALVDLQDCSLSSQETYIALEFLNRLLAVVNEQPD